MAASPLPVRRRAALVGATYDAAFAAERGASWSRLGDHDVDLLFRAARTAASYTLDPRHVDDMRSALDELERRRAVQPRHPLAMHEVLVKARMLAEATALERRYPALEPMPDLRDAAHLEPGLPTEWVVDPVARALLRRSVDLRDQVTVVVVSHPRCHFSRNAVRDIQGDPVLRPLFAAHARWLAPQDGQLELDEIQQWNRDNPGQETTLAYRRDEWPMIDAWGTPTFYFLDHGVVKATVTGWPRGGRRAELLAAFRLLGVPVADRATAVLGSR